MPILHTHKSFLNYTRHRKRECVMLRHGSWSYTYVAGTPFVPRSPPLWSSKEVTCKQHPPLSPLPSLTTHTHTHTGYLLAATQRCVNYAAVCPRPSPWSWPPSAVHLMLRYVCVLSVVGVEMKKHVDWEVGADPLAPI